MNAKLAYRDIRLNDREEDGLGGGWLGWVYM